MHPKTKAVAFLARVILWTALGLAALFAIGFLWGAGDVVFRFGRHHGIETTVKLLMPLNAKPKH